MSTTAYDYTKTDLKALKGLVGRYETEAHGIVVRVGEIIFGPPPRDPIALMWLELGLIQLRPRTLTEEDHTILKALNKDYEEIRDKIDAIKSIIEEQEGQQ